MKRIGKIVIVWMLMFACLPVIHSQADSKTVTIKVAFYPLDGFFEYDKEGKECGYGVDYLNELKKYANVNWEYVPVDSWEGIDQMMADGKVDVRMPVSEVMDPAESKSKFSHEPLLWTYHALMTKKENEDLYYKDYDTIKNMRVGISETLLDKDGVKEYIKANHLEKNIKYYTDYNSCRAGLDSQNVDAIISNVMDLEDDLKILDKFAVSKTYITTLKENEKFKIIDDAMTELTLENPSFQTELNQQYYPERNQEPFTKEEIKYMQETKSLTVAIYPNRRPVSYYDEKTKSFKGIAVDIGNAISGKIGIHFKYVPITTEQAKDMLKEADLVMPVLSENENAKYFATKSILDSEIMMVVRENEGELSADANVGVLKETAGIHSLVKQQNKYHMITFDTNEEALEALRIGQIDGFVNASYVINWLLENPRYKNLRVLRYQGVPLPYSICGKADNVILKSVLTKGINSLDENDTEQCIAENTAFSLSDLSMTDKLYMYRNEILAVSLILLILIALGLIYNHTRSKYIKEIKKRGEEQERANRAKSDFLSRMSHDMRTPMNGILGLTYIMEEQTDNVEIRRELQQQRSSGEYLLRLINDVLDVNKVENNEFELNPVQCYGKSMMDSIISLVAPQMDEKGIEFHFDNSKIDWHYLYVDVQRVKQIFVNLLSNAIKFTPAGGRIDFIMEKVDEDSTKIYEKFIVRDTGIGMSKDFLPKVFDAFAQEQRTTNSLDGTGLGLSIVKNIVDLMDGTISVKSEMDKGTEFTVMLQFPIAEKTLENGEKIEIQPVMPRKGLRILLCEDHPLNAQIAIRLLEKQGAHVTWRQNGKVGVDEFAQSELGAYELILMDIHMPEMDGLEAAAAIRALEREDAKSVPIIAMTANAYVEDVNKSIQAGMNAHIAKPIVPTVLFDTIGKYCPSDRE